ncbi:MAG: biotin-dependent carboxyltransferase family protein [Sulfurospirillum sp.]
MSYFRVIQSGIFSLVEDFGRFGLCDKGITNSGVMDEYAYMALNHILENEAGTNCIEITLGGLKLEANANCTIGVTGADVKFDINSKETDIWKTHDINRGDILEFGYAKKGARIYFGVKNGFEIKKELGSNSVTTKEEIGRNLQKGDLLYFRESADKYYNISLKKEFIPEYKDELTLRVVLGYQDEFFDKNEIEKFFSQTYIISSQNNRMGYKLNAEPVNCQIEGIVSEGISFGAIQVPKDGQPIILLKERQTIGGYPKIGSVLPIDCFKLSQMKAGGRIKFEPINIEASQKKMQLFYKIF